MLYAVCLVSSLNPSTARSGTFHFGWCPALRLRRCYSMHTCQPSPQVQEQGARPSLVAANHGATRQWSPAVKVNRAQCCSLSHDPGTEASTSPACRVWKRPSHLPPPAGPACRMQPSSPTVSVVIDICCVAPPRARAELQHRLTPAILCRPTDRPYQTPTASHQAAHRITPYLSIPIHTYPYLYPFRPAAALLPIPVVACQSSSVGSRADLHSTGTVIAQQPLDFISISILPRCQPIAAKHSVCSHRSRGIGLPPASPDGETPQRPRRGRRSPISWPRDGRSRAIPGDDAMDTQTRGRPLCHARPLRQEVLVRQGAPLRR